LNAVALRSLEDAEVILVDWGRRVNGVNPPRWETRRVNPNPARSNIDNRVVCVTTKHCVPRANRTGSVARKGHPGSRILGEVRGSHREGAVVPAVKVEVRLFIVAEKRRVKWRDGPSYPGVLRGGGIEREKVATLGKRHDVFAKQDVAASDTSSRTEQVDLVGPFVVSITCNAKDGGELTVLLKTTALVLFRTDVRETTPTFEDPKIGVGVEQHVVGARGYHFLRWSGRWGSRRGGGRDGGMVQIERGQIGRWECRGSGNGGEKEIRLGDGWTRQP
jgi:hypothetical protein